MDKMVVRVPVAIKAKVTEDLKISIIADLEETVKKIEADSKNFENAANEAMRQAAGNLQALPALREQIEVERAKITEAMNEATEKLQRARALDIGQEIGHGTLERTVEVTIGTDLESLMGAEILTEDGKIIAFRG